MGRIRQCLLGIGVPVRVKPGRRPAGLPRGGAVWLLGDQEQEVLVIPQGPKGATEAVGGFAANLPKLWIAEHIPKSTALRWIDEGRGFADAVGNANIELPGLVIRVLGNQPQVQARVVAEEHAGREWRGAALRVVFHLLCKPELARHTIRDLAKITGVAAGTIVNVLEDLEQSGHLVRLGARKRRFIPDPELHDRWIGEHGRKLRPTLLIGRFTAEDPLWHRDFDPVAHGARWGAEPAAVALGADLRPAIWTLYMPALHATALKVARLRADPAGQVEVRRVFWAEELPTPRRDTVPPLLIAADLLATRDGRCHAAATDIRNRFIHGPIEE